MVFPEKFNPDSPAEGILYDILNDILPADIIAIFKGRVGVLQYDLMLLIPNRGVLCIEIKGWSAKNLEICEPLNVVHKTNGKLGNPLDQAKHYSDTFRSLCENTNDNTYFAHTACFPFLTSFDLDNLKFNRLINDTFGESIFISSDDLTSYASFSKKIDLIFEEFYSIKFKDVTPYCYPHELIANHADILVPGVGSIYLSQFEDNSLVTYENEIYSILETSTIEDDERLIELFECWKNGTKIYYFSSKEENVKKLKSHIRKYVNDNDLTESLYDSNRDSYFNCTVAYSPKISDDFVIYNGENYEKYNAALEYIDELFLSEFNYGQYIVEYSNEDNIIVNAGAGSGKTFLLVSRIDYICWKDKIDANSLENDIILITFTNDATDEMKERLEKYFLKKYSLTKNTRYYSYLMCIENMRISTIDSMSMRILRKFSFNLGLGKNLMACSGTIQLREAIRAALNEILHGNDQHGILDAYMLEKYATQIIEKYQNKNIDVTNCDLKQVKNNRIDYLIEKIPEIVLEVERKCEEEGKIQTGNIIIYLNRLLKILEQKNSICSLPENIKYVFIDEFQDTDDTQIDLVAKFKKYLSFKLFVVGDVKQSIYRFRGADDDKAFFTLENKLFEFGQTIRRYDLLKNYRTNAQMLDVLDCIFKKMKMAGLFRSYDKKLKGVINLEEKALFNKHVVTSETERELKIRELIEKEKDCLRKTCLLVRTNAEVLRVRDICNRYNIAYVGFDIGGTLFASEAAIDLYKITLALQNPKDTSTLYNLYTTNYIDEPIKKWVINSANNKYKLFMDNIPHSLKLWEKCLSDIKVEPILKVLRTLTDDARPWDIYAEKYGDNYDHKMQLSQKYKSDFEQLFEMIAGQRSSSYMSIDSLVNYLQIMISTNQEVEERQSTDSNRIVCQTVHKAKGKEYDHVIIPFASDKIKKEKWAGNSSLSEMKNYSDFIVNENGIGYSISLKDGNTIENEFYSNNQALELVDQSYEEARIFYVALTRVKSELSYIELKNNNKNTSPKLWQDMMDFNA